MHLSGYGVEASFRQCGHGSEGDIFQNRPKQSKTAQNCPIRHFWQTPRPLGFFSRLAVAVPSSYNPPPSSRSPAWSQPGVISGGLSPHFLSPHLYFLKIFRRKHAPNSTVQRPVHLRACSAHPSVGCQVSHLGAIQICGISMLHVYCIRLASAMPLLLRATTTSSGALSNRLRLKMPNVKADDQPY